MKNKPLLYILAALIVINTAGCSEKAKPAPENNAAGSNGIIIEVVDDINPEGTDASEDSVGPHIYYTEINEETNEGENTDDQYVSEKVTEATGEARQFNSTKRVICYGDSLMEGTGGGGVTIPDTLAKLSGTEVLNYGVYADSASAVSARMGANPQYLVEDIIIPADSTPVKAQCSGKYGYEMLLNFGDAGINNVFLDGIEGKYFMTEKGERMFSRITPGEAKEVKEGTQLITHAMADKRPDDIIVLWAGANDTPQTNDEIQPVIDKLNEMLSYLGTSEYIVLNDISDFSRTPVVSEVNKRLSSEYGSRYLDIRGYLINHAINDLEITATDTDKEKIAKGEVPPSLLSDEVHGTSDYYRLVGEQVYRKLKELGYLK